MGKELGKGVPKSGNIPLPNGYNLYWKDNGIGGRIYFTDEVGEGTHVWDTCLVDQSTLTAAITQEYTLLHQEFIERERQSKTPLRRGHRR